jgi:hypothetical protein
MSEQDALDKKLECAFAGIGAEVGKLVRCLIQQELATHVARIEQLNAILTGGACAPTASNSNDGESPAA